MTQLLTLTTINEITQNQVTNVEPFQWVLDRQKERTVWEIEFADPFAEQITEFKIDAHDGTIVQSKLKN